ncbi:nucleoporin NUP188 homolog [Stegodyphus dumicola]|uniref:nucleoporin NUP188 homolog n=1 Tax=Stegodyphus dumicola TaxID=202533 RepID=UPI0015AD2390|nr:nucleoporin NUP188 homolog [Stegodyphus dumicola]
MTVCQQMLQWLNVDPNLLEKVVTGDETWVYNDLGEQVTSMIRLSLSVLNRLLLLRNNVTLMSSKRETTPLEAVLFSTPGHVTQPQVVLMVAHYAFQRYNPRLATLAVQLLKRFAKEFPMSLLACFGSEAEAIRDHFLARLRSLYEDIRLKVSILEFLTVCVAQQPGLIEMFINVQKKDEKTCTEEENKSCLECVKKILKEKKDETIQTVSNSLLFKACKATQNVIPVAANNVQAKLQSFQEQFKSSVDNNLNISAIDKGRGRNHPELQTITEGEKPAAIHHQMMTVYREKCDKSVRKWSARFRAARESVGDDPRPGQANTVIMSHLIDKVDDLVRSDRCVTLRMLAVKVDVSYGTLWTIVHDRLRYRKSTDSYPQDLLCASVEFIHALWAGHQALAIEALKQEERLNEHVKAIFKKIHSENFLLKWSEHIHSSNLSSTSPDCTQQIFDFASGDLQDAFALITAWRDFLLIVAVYEPLEIPSDTKKKILKDILEHFMVERSSSEEDQRERNSSSRILILLSELFLMLSQHWQRELMNFIKSDEENNPVFKMLYDTAYNADSIHPREQLVVVSIALFTVRIFSKSSIKISNIKDWILPACQLLRKTSISFHHLIDTESAAGVLKLPIVIICLLNELIQETDDWLPVLKNNSILPLLVSFLIKSLKLNIGVELAHSIITFFLYIASDKKAAEALCNTGFMAEVTLILAETDLQLHISEKKKSLVPQKPKLTKVDVYFAFLRFITTLLHTLGNYFLPDCWNFIGVHQEIMHVSLMEMRMTLLKEGIQNAILTSAFILQLSFHQKIWRLEHPRSLQLLLIDVCNCIYGTVAILSKPGLLKYLVMHKKMPDSKLSPLKNLETESLLKRLISEDENQQPPEVSDVQQKLFELLAVNLTVLKKYTPEMYESMSGHAIDYSEWQLLLHVSFSIPSVDQDGPLGFGTILSCINMCLKSLVKNEKAPSPRKCTESPAQMPRHLLSYILEISLTLLLSQSSIALSHPDLPMRDKQLIRRELAAELNSINITINRYLRRGPLSPAGIPVSASVAAAKSPSKEFPFMKLISNLVDKLFK